MNYECRLNDEGDDLWVSCTIIDSFSKADQYFVSYKLGQEVLQKWVPNDELRRIHYGFEPSY